ncbi:hypothetical protein [Mycolicibacterium obuense]|uniref:hypothetical protein n=1 Tax=Mycolicibacterium obuense TaxID=1807 RepID=UPI001F36743A|nr:hypothetical protein [Mycolicibacterium obuense]
MGDGLGAFRDQNVEGGAADVGAGADDAGVLAGGGVAAAACHLHSPLPVVSGALN